MAMNTTGNASSVNSAPLSLRIRREVLDCDFPSAHSIPQCPSRQTQEERLQACFMRFKCQQWNLCVFQKFKDDAQIAGASVSLGFQALANQDAQLSIELR